MKVIVEKRLGGALLKGFFAVFGIAAAWFAVAAAPDVPAARAQGAPDTLKVAVASDIISLDPARVDRHFLTQVVQSLLYDTLLERGANSSAALEPGLASSYGAPDALHWTFTIPAQQSTTGAQFALEVATHFQRIVSGNGLGGFPSPARVRLEGVERVSANGDRLTFTLSAPWPGLPWALTEEPVARVDVQGRVIPTGPFELERWDHGNRVILKRRGEAGEGEFSRIWFEVVPDADERLRRLLSGEFHVAFGLPPAGYWTLRLSKDAKPVVVPQPRVRFVELNVTRPPFSDPRVRRALNMAVDMDAVIRLTMQDQAIPVATLLSPVTPGYDPEVVRFGFDPVRAKELLAEAGYPEGFDFELDVTPRYRLVAERIREMLARVGVGVVVRVWDSSETLRREIEFGRRTAWMSETELGRDPRDFIWPKLHSEGERNWSGYRSETLDFLLDEAESTLDPRRRLEHYGTIQRFLRQDAPYLFAYVEYDVYGALRRLDWRPGPGHDLMLDRARWQGGS